MENISYERTYLHFKTSLEKFKENKTLINFFETMVCSLRILKRTYSLSDYDWKEIEEVKELAFTITDEEISNFNYDDKKSFRKCLDDLRKMEK